MYIRQLTAADIPFGLRLCAQNRWNQLEADWQRQLALEPRGCFLAMDAGQPVGTACCCVFGEVAWISLVLVEETQRGRGFGGALMRHVVQYLEERGVASIRLDATPLGQPVYEKLGFVGEFTLARYAGRFRYPAEAAPGIEPLTDDDLPAVFELDETITQTRRHKLLRHLFEGCPGMARKCVLDGRLEGYSMARGGANAWQIGPIQGTLQAGTRLLRDAANRRAGQPVYLDVPIDQSAAISLVESLGLTIQRQLLRMGRGRRLHEDLSRFWSGFGPEKG
jgi:GNAT superfamily N-acetyltransferase